MSSPKQVIVIGAGIIGASIAWHLTKAGAQVTVVSESGAGGVATPNSFAWVNASWGNPEIYFQLRIRAMSEWTRLAKDVPGLPFAWCGGLCFDLPPDRLEAYAAEHSSWGYGIERVDAKRAGEIEPNLVAPPDFAVYVAEEGVELPLDTPPGLIVHSRPHRKLLNGLVHAERLHMRQTAEGRIIAGSDFAGGDPGEDPEAAARQLFAVTKAALRGADELELDFHTVGYRPTPVDGFPVISRADGVGGLYIAVMHSGITLAPAVGLFAAREILEGERDVLLTPYGLERFAR
ncbi:MAG: FAD-binding oxidoreductase [Mesorhizobium sp.]|uniref:NAD(P)/FAD-dependent oxidoreductase n=1 Tax=Mesorhizobium sp. TaxID=1871066 RepID=UPI0011FC0746|nr:FAD-binding oxidoreductase [Mesorhizobium sp.]TIT08153.1 MAG: FAD-binding oxidoreductase [Mesorhizobium sp.]